MCGLPDSNRAGIEIDHTFCKTNPIVKIVNQPNKNLFLQAPALPSKEYFGDIQRMIYISEVIYLFYAVVLAFKSQNKCRA